MSKEVRLANSDKTATVDDCCYPYISQFQWHLMEDGSAARTEECKGHPEPHLIRMEDEVAGRHRCEIEHNSGLWDDDDEAADCYDCGVEAGQRHKGGCDIARCLYTGQQRLACNGRHDCGNDAWTGVWPGEAECIEFGWYSKWVDDAGKLIEPPDYLQRRGHWVETTADDPDGSPDLNRLEEEARWDRKAERWVLRGTK